MVLPKSIVILFLLLLSSNLIGLYHGFIYSPVNRHFVFFFPRLGILQIKWLWTYTFVSCRRGIIEKHSKHILTLTLTFFIVFPLFDT